MIVCSCNVICDRRIKKAIDRLRASEPNTLMTPGKVFKQLGCRPSCGTCLTHIAKLIHEAPEAFSDKGENPARPRGTSRTSNRGLEERMAI